MAVRKRAPTRRARTGAVKSRVIKITSMEQWERIVRKTGDALLFVYVLSPARGSAVFRATLALLARQPAWSHVTFAEVDITQLPAFEGVSGQAGLPTTQCYKNGELVASLRPTEASQPRMEQLLKTHAGPKPKPVWWQSALAKVVLVGGVLAGAYVGFRHVTRPKVADETALRAVNRQIQRAQRRLAMAKRQKRSSAAKNAAEQLEVLYQQQQDLEKEEHSGGSQQKKGNTRRLPRMAQEAISDDEAAPAGSQDLGEEESESDFEL